MLITLFRSFLLLFAVKVLEHLVSVRIHLQRMHFKITFECCAICFENPPVGYFAIKKGVGPNVLKLAPTNDNAIDTNFLYWKLFRLADSIGCIDFERRGGVTIIVNRLFPRKVHVLGTYQFISVVSVILESETRLDVRVLLQGQIEETFNPLDVCGQV